jgi:hypothetical protein
VITNIEREFRGAVLGDQRRSARLERIGTRLALDPSRSFPEAMASEGQLEAFYRFLNSDDVNLAGILRPHAMMTAERCGDRDDILILHDTTSLEFTGAREGLGRLQTSARRGFFLHASLAVTAAREPMGVVAAETWVRDRAPRKSRNQRHRRNDPNRESLRWVRGVLGAGHVLRHPLRCIHVMDREGDNYDLFACLQAESIRHVVRLAHNRNLVGTTQKLKERALAAKCKFRREVHVSRRTTTRTLDHKGIHPERNARNATLSVSAVAVELLRSNNFAEGSPPSLKANVVTVRETGCPRGVEPIVWFLVTTEPVETREQLELIVDAYRARWLIEEFFKALKTGCQFERRQLESYRSLSNALAIFLPLAVRLLALRGAARAAPSEPCSTLTRRQVALLRTYTTRFMSAVPTNEEVALALAEFGGHLRSNGPPGWLVLGRAFERLLLIEIGSNHRKDVIDD